ncbi:MAG: SLBB domain-containing protein, partial [Burkholderiales bacterium]
EHEKRVAFDVDFTELKSQGFKVLDGDLVRVYPVLPEQRDVVTVKGSVNRPGKFQFREGMKIADLVTQAEGVAPRTFFKYALIRRKEGPAKQINLLAVDLSSALSGASNANLTLQPEDELTVYSETQMKQLPTVQVFGEVRNPGFYVLSQGMKVSDLVYLAGGLKDNAFLRQAELARTQVVNGARTSHSFRELNLGEALAGVETQNAPLEANDQLFVRRATDWHLPWIVHVRGQVGRPGPYTIRDDERIATVIQRSGGLLNDAYLPATVLIRQSVKKLQQQRLDEARSRLRQAIARLQLMPDSMRGRNNKDQSAQETVMAMAMLEKLLSESEGEQAQGRVVIHLRPLDELAKSPDNIVLVDQDVVTIPRRPAAVNVLGEVYSPNAIVWKPGLTTRDYLELAGGPAEGADSDHIMVVKADGSVLTEDAIASRKESQMFPLLPVVSGGLMSAQLEPGDTVYVPEKLIYVDKMQIVSTVTQIISSAAQSLAVVGLLALR